MKKISTLLLLFISFLSTNTAQVSWSENFDNGIPPTWKVHTLDNNTPTAPFAQGQPGWFAYNRQVISTSYFTPVSTSNRWLVSPKITVPALVNPNNRILLYWYEANTSTTNPDGYEVHVGWTDQEVVNLDSTLLKVNKFTTTVNGRNRSIDLTAFQGQEIFLAWRNNTFDGRYLLLDDIQIGEIKPFDMKTVQSLNLSYNKENSNIFMNGIFRNMGYNNVTSFFFNYSVDGAAPFPVVMSANLEPFNSTQFVSSKAYKGTKGVHVVKMWPSDINGQSDLGDISDDTLTLEFVVYNSSDEVTRTPLSEMFTSSTCPPCKAGWEKYESVVAGTPKKPLQIKYQQDFPGTGDPYTTSETVSRRGNYQVNSIPNLVIDGNFLQINPSSTTSTMINNSFNHAGLGTLDMKYEVDVTNKTVHVWGTVTPQVYGTGKLRLMTAIYEKLTTKNVKTNGETKFINVVKKLLPDIDGMSLDGAVEDATLNIDLTYTFNGNYRLPLDGQPANIIKLDQEHSVEEFTDLGAMVWLECGRDNNIFNATGAQLVSGTKEIPAIHSLVVSPNPVVNTATLTLKLNDALSGTIKLVDLQGKEVWNSGSSQWGSGTHLVALPTENLANGSYQVILVAGYKVGSTTLIVNR